ncbi:hypothetical protein COY59_04870 [Candidatus Gottesmanbacteria bacterium CG_4_10_14_0_8_um_filter_37_24]|uniref:Energy-coupling factor transporter transmembrane protein EcfT n=2 Tax=Candidatus Gottesmaniibacteriota TaxID=1752720 RepID=A0A2M7RQ19_9BACT|nr:MAG: hypothetical protein COY59_04870 [Candidatus Gottesmanbacteria bacterium CG_4_10_14_0_8_um_filter_37_24]
MLTKLFPILKLFFLIAFSTILITVKDNFILIISSIIMLLSAFLIVTLCKKREEFADRYHALIIMSLLIVMFQLIFNVDINIWQRLQNGIISALKISSLSLLVLIYTSVTSLSEIIHIFSFPPSKIGLVLTITLSLIPIIIQEYRKILIIQSTKGQNFKHINPLTNFMPILIPLMHRSINRAEHIAIVIESKGYLV